VDTTRERGGGQQADAGDGSTLIIQADGGVRPGDDAAQRALVRHAGRYALSEVAPGVLLLQSEEASDRERLLTFGQITDATSILEIIQAVAANDWQGVLTVCSTGARRRLRIDRGMLTSAESDLASERLGEVMVAMGAITKDQLAHCLRRSGGRRLGETIVLEGFVEPDMLFTMLKAQARRIFEAALTVTDGHYLFGVPSEDVDPPPMAVHVGLQGLLMQSLQRLDEMAMFRERIPNGHASPVVTGTPARMTLDRRLRAVADLSSGEHSILDIARELGLDEFSVTKAVMQLLQLGCVEVVDEHTDYEGRIREIVARLNAILRRIADVVEQEQAGNELSWTFDAWIQDGELHKYFGENPTAHGDISAERTLEALGQLGIEDPYSVLLNVATDLVSFAMFSASPHLPRPTERSLSKWVNGQVLEFGYSSRVSTPPRQSPSTPPPR